MQKAVKLRNPARRETTEGQWVIFQRDQGLLATCNQSLQHTPIVLEHMSSSALEADIQRQ